MSFDKIVQSDVVRKRKEIQIGEYKFYATEMNYPLRLSLSTAKDREEQFFGLVISSIEDADGNKMTRKQAEQLPDDIAEKFFIAAVEVNDVGLEKN